MCSPFCDLLHARIKRCSQIMGRSEGDDQPAAQIMYPCMQVRDAVAVGAILSFVASHHFRRVYDGGRHAASHRHGACWGFGLRSVRTYSTCKPISASWVWTRGR